MQHMTTGLLLLLATSQVLAQGPTPRRYPAISENIVVVSTDDRNGLYVNSPNANYLTYTHIGAANKNNYQSLNGVLTLRNTPFIFAGIPSAHKYDSWANGPISFPFPGLLCTSSFSSRCKGGSTIAMPALVDSKGFYGFADRVTDMSEGLRNKLTQNTFYYLKDMPVGGSFTMELNSCLYRDPNRYNSCVKQTDATLADWRVIDLITNKVGHMRFNTIDFNQEFVIDSSGNPVAAPGVTRCIPDWQFRHGGYTCTIGSVNLQWTGSPSPFSRFFLTGIRRAGVGGGIAIGYKVGDFPWIETPQGGTDNPWNTERIGNLTGTHEIKLFLSNELIKYYVNRGSLQLDNLMEFYTTPTNNWNSGYYIPFTGTFTTTPRAQTVAIKATDESLHPYREGEVGKDDLAFKYEVSETGYTNANRLEISVRQDSGLPHQGLCTFYPDNQIREDRAVPVPTSLSFNLAGNQPRELPIRCDGTPIDLRSQNIAESKPAEEWDVGGIGYTRFYEVGLNFKLTDDMVAKTVTGNNWEGAAHQSGTITIKGIWN